MLAMINKGNCATRLVKVHQSQTWRVCAKYITIFISIMVTPAKTNSFHMHHENNVLPLDVQKCNASL